MESDIALVLAQKDYAKARETGGHQGIQIQSRVKGPGRQAAPESAYLVTYKDKAKGAGETSTTRVAAMMLCINKINKRMKAKDIEVLAVDCRPFELKTISYRATTNTSTQTWRW
jgi:hypothetical protein